MTGVLATLFSALSIAGLNTPEEPASGGTDAYVPPSRRVDPSATGEVVSRTVLGVDGRTDMDTDEFPWSTVGYLDVGSGHCTATLVGRDLILTNSHCVHDSEGRVLRPDELRFYPTHRDGHDGIYSSGRQIYLDNLGFRSEFVNDSQDYADWALVRLQSPLGDDYGWLGVSESDPMEGLTLAGFSGDYKQGDTAGVDQGCSIREIREHGLLVHDCDTTAGSSGSALFHSKEDNFLVVGLNSAERSNPETGERYVGAVPFDSEDAFNIGVKTQLFMGLVQQLNSAARTVKDGWIHVCNVHESDGEVALAIVDDGGAVTIRGKVEADSCVELQTTQTAQKVALIHDFGAPSVPEEGTPLCAARDQGVVHDAARETCAGNESALVFAEIVSPADRLNVYYLEAPPEKSGETSRQGRSGVNRVSPSKKGRTPFQLCNASDTPLRVAHAWDSGATVSVAGWTQVAAGECGEAAIPIPYSGSFGLYAPEYGGESGVPLCVDPTADFQLEDGMQSCTGKMQRVNFTVAVIRPGEDNTFTFR